MRNVHIEYIYNSGARMAIRRLTEMIVPYLKGKEAIYAKAIIRLALSDMPSTEKFLQGESIGFRNHQRKGKDLVNTEAYFN